MLTGEPDYSVLYRTWARPTLEVHGIPGGFVGTRRQDGHSGERLGQGLDAPGARIRIPTTS